MSEIELTKEQKELAEIARKAIRVHRSRDHPYTENERKEKDQAIKNYMNSFNNLIKD